MSDEHSGLSHDLPDYEVLDLYGVPWKKVQVFKRNDYWTWGHTCPWRPADTPASGYPHLTHKIAMAFAWQHVRNCL